MSHGQILPLFLLTLLGACATSQEVPSNGPILSPTILEAVAEFIDRQPTGLAVSRKGRIFVTFPRWGLPQRLLEPMDPRQTQSGRAFHQRTKLGGDRLHPSSLRRFLNQPIA